MQYIHKIQINIFMVSQTQIFTDAEPPLLFDDNARFDDDLQSISAPCSINTSGIKFCLKMGEEKETH